MPILEPKWLQFENLHLSVWVIGSRSLTEDQLRAAVLAVSVLQGLESLQFPVRQLRALPVLKSVKGETKQNKQTNNNQGFIEILHSFLEWRQNK